MLRSLSTPLLTEDLKPQVITVEAPRLTFYDFDRAEIMCGTLERTKKDLVETCLLGVHNWTSPLY